MTEHIDGANNSYFDYEPSAEISLIATTAQRVKDELHRQIVGNDAVIETLFICLLAEGNILITGNPGVAKTTIAKTFAQALGCKFNRQQFTPDVFPTDVTGSYVFDQKTNEFYVRKGGIFANIVMIDEINRGSPRTQSALLEAMEEKNVTIEGTTFTLERPFMVIATQTMVETEGTFPLPKVQLDRFSLHVTLDYPDPDQALEILQIKSSSDERAVAQITDKRTILNMIETVRGVYVADSVLRYMRDIIEGTRHRADVTLAASPRSSVHLLNASKALAAIRRRDYVIPDDVQDIVHVTLGHRLILSEKAILGGVTATQVLSDILAETVVE